jgi:hypothetical protein
MSSHRKINPPEVMLARFAYLLHLGAGLAALLLAVAGLARKNPSWLAQSALLLSLSASLWCLLRRVRRLDECRESLGTLFNPAQKPDPDDPNALLDALLERRSALENTRGTPAFDPWALLVVQNEIREHLRSHPVGRDDGDALPRPRRGRA